MSMLDNALMRILTLERARYTLESRLIALETQYSSLQASLSNANGAAGSVGVGAGGGGGGMYPTISPGGGIGPGGSEYVSYGGNTYLVFNPFSTAFPGGKDMYFGFDPNGNPILLGGAC